MTKQPSAESRINVNVRIGELRTGKSTAVCTVCETARPHRELNWEGTAHHNTRGLECIDRGACERRARKRGR